MSIIQNISSDLNHLDKNNGLKLKIQRAILTELSRSEYDDLCGYIVSQALTELAEKFAANSRILETINGASLD